MLSKKVEIHFNELKVQRLEYQPLKNNNILLKRYFVRYQGPGRWEECTNGCESAF